MTRKKFIKWLMHKDVSYDERIRKTVSRNDAVAIARYVYSHGLQYSDTRVSFSKDIHGLYFIIDNPSFKHCCLIYRNGRFCFRDASPQGTSSLSYCTYNFNFSL